MFNLGLSKTMVFLNLGLKVLWFVLQGYAFWLEKEKIYLSMINDLDCGNQNNDGEIILLMKNLDMSWNIFR